MIQATVKDGEVQRLEGHSGWKLFYWEESIHWNVNEIQICWKKVLAILRGLEFFY